MLLLIIKEVWNNFMNFYRDSLRALGFQTLITLLFEDCWLSNLKWRIFKTRKTILQSLARNIEVTGDSFAVS